MSFTFVQSNVSNSSDTITLNGVTAGNLIVLWAKWEEASVNDSVSVTDGTSTLANGWSIHYGDSTPSGQFAYLLSANSGNRTYTVTWPDSASFKRLRIAEFSYTGGTISMDTQNGNGSTGSSCSSANITTTGTDELCFGGYSEYTSAVLSSWDIGGSGYDGTVGGASLAQMWYKAFSGTFTGQASANMSISGEWVCNIISFKITAAGGAPSTLNRIEKRILRGTGRGIGRGLS